MCNNHDNLSTSAVEGPFLDDSLTSSQISNSCTDFSGRSNSNYRNAPPLHLISNLICTMYRSSNNINAGNSKTF